MDWAEHRQLGSMKRRRLCGKSSVAALTFEVITAAAGVYFGAWCYIQAFLGG
jgi:hypothetical protein